MKIDIVLKLSKSFIQIYFSQNKSEFRLYNYESNPITPLYFFSNKQEFIIGEKAKLRYESNYDDSYKGYFNIIKNTSSEFTFIDNNKYKFKELLVYGLETILNSFLKDILLVDKSLKDLKDEINLIFLCDSDIEEFEIIFLDNLFKNEYKNFSVYRLDILLINFLDLKRKTAAHKNYLTLTGIESNLYINLYDNLISKSPKLSDIGLGLAINPRDKVIAELIFDQIIQRTGSRVKIESEINSLISLAEQYTKSDKREFYVRGAKLSDGSSADVKIKMAFVDHKISFDSDSKDFQLISHFIKSKKVNNADLGIVLFGNISSDNLINKLKSNYNNIYFFQDEFDEVLNYLKSNIVNLKSLNYCENNQVEKNILLNTDNTNKDVRNKNNSSKLNIPTKKESGHKLVSTNSDKKRFSPPPPPPLAVNNKSKALNIKPVVQNKKNASTPPPPPPPPIKRNTTAKVITPIPDKNKSINPAPPQPKKTNSIKSPPPLPNNSSLKSPPPLPNKTNSLKSPPPLPKKTNSLKSPPPLPKKWEILFC